MAAILVVEDDSNITSLLQFMFEREGHVVTLLADGEAAYLHIVSQPAPDLVLLDSMLPYRDGLRLLNVLRSQNGWGWAEVPVVMLTARSLERDIVTALDAGANDYVVKPFQPHELLARVRRLLGVKV